MCPFIRRDHLRRHDASFGIEQRHAFCRRGHLHRNLSHASAHPPQRVEHNHWDACLHAGIHTCRQRLERFCCHLIRSPAHLVIVFLCFSIDTPDPRSCSQIVEVIEEHVLPGTCQFISRIGLPVEPGKRSILLRIQNPLFTVSHIALVISLRRKYSAMIFEI